MRSRFELSTIEDFQELCIQQEVELHPVLSSSEALHKAFENLKFSCETRGPLDAAIAVAAQHIRDTDLNNLPLLANDDTIAVPHTADTGVKTLAAIINSQRDPASAQYPNLYSFDSRPNKKSTINLPHGSRFINCCSGCEANFAVNFQDMASGSPAQIGGDLILAPDNTMLAYRKPNGDNSSLTLQKLTIDDIVYPAGSVLRIDTSDQIYCKKVNWPKPSQDHLRILPSSSVLHAACMRLSVFAYTPKERDTMVFNRYTERGSPRYYTENVQQLVRTLSMTAINHIIGAAAEPALQRYFQDSGT